MNIQPGQQVRQQSQVPGDLRWGGGGRVVSCVIVAVREQNREWPVGVGKRLSDYVNSGQIEQDCGETGDSKNRQVIPKPEWWSEETGWAEGERQLRKGHVIFKVLQTMQTNNGKAHQHCWVVRRAHLQFGGVNLHRSLGWFCPLTCLGQRKRKEVLEQWFKNI